MKCCCRIAARNRVCGLVGCTNGCCDEGYELNSKEGGCGK